MTTEHLQISLKESKEALLNIFLSETINELTRLGFTLPQIIDALTNYVYLNTSSVDAICHLTQASLALIKKEISQ